MALCFFECTNTCQDTFLFGLVGRSVGRREHVGLYNEWH